MKYEYRCLCGMQFERDFRMGEAPSTSGCQCGRQAGRRYSAQAFNMNDPFRSYHLSGKKEREAVRQQRAVEGPTDKLEAKIMGEQQGRIYVGDDISGFTPKARKAIEDRRGKP